MDSDIGAMLQSVLSDPEQMSRIGQIARELTAPAGGDAGKERNTSEKNDLPPSLDDRLLQAMGKAFSGAAGHSRSTELLTAMRPYMRPEKREKLDRAIKIAQMARVAGIVMGEFGGAYGL